MSDTVILWLRRDLRLADNPAVVEAGRRGVVVPVVLWDVRSSPDGGGRPLPGRPVDLAALQRPSGSPVREGAAAQWWRRRSLVALDGDLRRRRSRLVVRRVAEAAHEPGRDRDDRTGPSTAGALLTLAHEVGAQAVVWSAGLGPGETDEDGVVQAALRAGGVEPVLVPGAGLLAPPSSLVTRQGEPFRVFTPFWRTVLREVDPGEPTPAPSRLRAPRSWPPSVPLEGLCEEAARPWEAGFAEAWEPGEAGALARLARLREDVLPRYADARDRPDLPATSRLSPHLHHGELSARQVWTAATDGQSADRLGPGAAAFLRQLAWREFAHHLLAALPHTVVEALRPEFERFPWRIDAHALAAWQLGQTGYPLVDAGMRQLWSTGWMHNRARLVVASFLVKDLLLPWQTGAAWFWDTLVDADLADNTLGWQWVAGSGADAAPYFRILNPVTQGRRFDPDGDFVRRHLPELRRLPGPWIHAPWQASPEELARAGVRLGETYPFPIVDHMAARRRALAAFDVVKGATRDQGA